MVIVYNDYEFMLVIKLVVVVGYGVFILMD